MKAPNKAKKYIKDREYLREYECTICFDLDPNVRRCSGPCKSAICLRCATYTSQHSKNLICPQRCSNKLVLEAIPQLKMQFLCPFDGEKCKVTIVGMQAFAQHKCEYMSQQALQDQMQLEEHVCHKGHPLLFIKRRNVECADCGEKRLCSSQCIECSTKSQSKSILFCHDCRGLPCTKSQCPFGHRFEKVQVADKNKYCDLCGFCIILYSDHCYTDKKCPLDICGLCLQKLPDQSHLIPIQRNRQYQKEIKKKNANKEPQQHFFDVDFDGSSFQECRSDQNENQEGYNEWAGNGNQIGQEIQQQNEQQAYSFDEFGQQLIIPYQSHLNADGFDQDLDNLQNQYANWLL